MRATTNTGVIYTTTGEPLRGEIRDYHRKPDALFLNKTKYKVDVAGLKPATMKNALIQSANEIESRFTIGFEVEKNELATGAVREYELFCGFENDGSCGYEAVTHVLPLLPAGQWRTKVFDMMHKAEHIIDDRFSPSNYKCGGHVTIGVNGMTGEQINEAVRGNAGIVLALFRNRLKNMYCGHNRRMTSNLGWGYVNSVNNNGWHYKYQTALVKGDCLEFRVVSKFENVKQMMRRYELFYELVDFSINNPNGSHDAFLKRVEPIVMSMYGGSESKTKEVMKLAKHFRKFILNNDIHEDIARYVSLHA